MDPLDRQTNAWRYRTASVRLQPANAMIAAKTKVERFGLKFGLKENKTPGGEQYLDPPGVELSAWL